MEEVIICPYCLTDQNNYKCEKTCNKCNTTYCIQCNEPFHIINFKIIKGHYELCYYNYKAKY
jgi:hypothetical protein